MWWGVCGEGGREGEREGGRERERGDISFNELAHLFVEAQVQNLSQQLETQGGAAI